MTELHFEVTFLAPFAVASGVAHDGMDTTIDRGNPLPSTAIKGLLKAHLRDTLGAPAGLVARIFHGGDSLRWVFSDADFAAGVDVNAWTRVQVDDDGRADERQLMVGEQACASKCTFTVRWEGRGPAPAGEVLALRAAARSITSLGSHRRRGLGWVSITDQDPTVSWTLDDSRRLRECIADGRVGA